MKKYLIILLFISFAGTTLLTSCKKDFLKETPYSSLAPETLGDSLGIDASLIGLYNHLRENEIFAQVHYIPAHLLPYYESLGWKKGDLPVAETYYRHCLSLPMYPTLTEEEQQYVIDQINSFK